MIGSQVESSSLTLFEVTILNQNKRCQRNHAFLRITFYVLQRYSKKDSDVATFL